MMTKQGKKELPDYLEYRPGYGVCMKGSPSCLLGYDLWDDPRHLRGTTRLCKA